MNTSSFAGFHFLPPTIHLPPELRPVHAATMTTTSEMAKVTEAIASASVMLQHAVATDHMFPLAIGQA